MHDIRDMERLAKRKDAIEEIYAERKRQIETEGWTPEHDDKHGSGALARAAACYAVGSKMERQDRVYYGGARTRRFETTSVWPWSAEWWKPKDRRRDLIRAGALIVAEIERLDRAEGKS